MMSLLDQLKNLLGTEIAALAAFGWAVAWGAAQNFFDSLLCTDHQPAQARQTSCAMGWIFFKAETEGSLSKGRGTAYYNCYCRDLGIWMGPNGFGVTNLIGTGEQIGAAAASVSAGFNTPHPAARRRGWLCRYFDEEDKPDE
jgi:hypothetical protein